MLVGLEIVVGHGMNLDDKQRKCLRLYINATKVFLTVWTLCIKVLTSYRKIAMVSNMVLYGIKF